MERRPGRLDVECHPDLLDEDHPDVVRHGPCPGLVRKDCCPDERLGEECPYPVPKRMDCYPDEECRLGLLGSEALAHPKLQPEPEWPEPLPEMELERRLRPGLQEPEPKALRQRHLALQEPEQPERQAQLVRWQPE